MKAARRSTPDQRKALEKTAKAMAVAAERGDLAGFMRLDNGFDRLVESASRSAFASRPPFPCMRTAAGSGISTGTTEPATRRGASLRHDARGCAETNRVPARRRTHLSITSKNLQTALDLV